MAAGVERCTSETSRATRRSTSCIPGDTPAIEAFLRGPWVKVITDKTGLLIGFLIRRREISFATTGAQEVYRWDVSSRSSRAGLYIVGSNELIDLIKLQMSVVVTAADTVEISAVDNPLVVRHLPAGMDPSAAARVMARQGIEPLTQKKPPVGLYRNDKGDEFDFSAEVNLGLPACAMTGAMAVFPLGSVTVLQLKVPPRPGSPGMSKAYSMETKEEASTSRVVRTIRLQSGILSSRAGIPISPTPSGSNRWKEPPRRAD